MSTGSFSATRFDGRAADAKATLTIAGYRAQDGWIPLRRHGIDRGDDATAVALVDAHAHATNAADSGH